MNNIFEITKDKFEMSFMSLVGGWGLVGGGLNRLPSPHQNEKGTLPDLKIVTI